MFLGSFKENKTNAERGKTVAVKFPIETKSLKEIEHELEIMALVKFVESFYSVKHTGRQISCLIAYFQMY